MNARRKLFIAGGAAVMVLGSASTAAAGTDAVAETRGGEAWVKFISYGDKFKVCDQYPNGLDGFSVYVEYNYIRKDGTTQSGRHNVGTGAGTCATFDHNFGEGRSVVFRAGIDVPAFPDPVSVWKTGVA
ncbi:hypothetical protein ACH437_28140 [Streptomyces xinghaiensis]|uniref:hypothetical protein n=1 Tax=Streptomyces xinghaiensis TaxID=1038928 RepID=UPI0037A23A18